MVPFDDHVCQRFELLAVQLTVQAGARAPSIRMRDLATLLECARRGDAKQDAVDHRPAREHLSNRIVAPRREQQRQRRRALSKIGAADLSSLERDARAVEDVVRDLERDSECQPKGAGAVRKAAAWATRS